MTTSIISSIASEVRHYAESVILKFLPVWAANHAGKLTEKSGLLATIPLKIKQIPAPPFPCKPFPHIFPVNGAGIKA